MSISTNLSEVRDQITANCRAAKRGHSDVVLIAVSKTQPVSAIEAAYAAGQRDFGENYVQELIEKRAKLVHLVDIRWHLIGPVQTNKAKFLFENATYFHALDSIKLGKEIEKRFRSLTGPRQRLPVFIQINFDNEATKSGARVGAEIEELIEFVRTSESMKLQGFMTIPAPRNSDAEMRVTFRHVRELIESLRSKMNLSSEESQLSMGMSEDFGAAILEGAHWIRVGRKIFGERHVQR